jgi:hypothetical protein
MIASLISFAIFVSPEIEKACMNHEDELVQVSEYSGGTQSTVVRVVLNIILAVASFKRATTSVTSDDRAT